MIFSQGDYSRRRGFGPPILVVGRSCRPRASRCADCFGRVVIILRMTATIATLPAVPPILRRLWNALSTGYQLLALIAARSVSLQRRRPTRQVSPRIQQRPRARAVIPSGGGQMSPVLPQLRIRSCFLPSASLSRSPKVRASPAQGGAHQGRGNKCYVRRVTNRSGPRWRHPDPAAVLPIPATLLP